MVVIDALRETPGSLARNPVVFVPVFVLMLTQVPQLLLQSVNPILAGVASLGISLLFVLVVPFFQGGLVAMANEALDGRTSLDRFRSAGRDHYVSLLVAYLLVLGVNFVVGFVAFLVAIVGGVALFAGNGGASLAVLAVVGVVVLLFVLAYLVVLFFVQFYGHAIVLDDLGAVDGLKHSVGVVRANLASTLGYSVLVGVLGLLAGGVFSVASILASPRTTAPMVAIPEPSLAAVAAVSLVVVLLGTLFGGFFGVYSVAFYRRIDPGVAG